MHPWCFLVDSTSSSVAVPTAPGARRSHAGRAGRPEREISRDEMLDNISLYWLTDTAASSARLCYESFGTDFSTQRLDLPVAVSIFPGELFLPPRLWGERVYSRLFYWNEAARGGHFAAFEQPAVFVEELRAAFRALPRGG